MTESTQWFIDYLEYKVWCLTQGEEPHCYEFYVSASIESGFKPIGYWID
jgi:hypothetical protein